MSKYLLLLGALLFAVPVFATSGACSSHGGVNCNAQTQDGYAYCLDGSVSSVLYLDMAECSNRPQCVKPTPSQCTSQSDYQALSASLYPNGIGHGSSSSNALLLQCQAAIATFQSQQSLYLKCTTPIVVHYCPPGVYMNGNGVCIPGVTVGQIVNYNAIAAQQDDAEHAKLVQMIADLLKQIAVLQAQIQARLHPSM